VNRIGPWLSRAGAGLAAAAFFLPQQAGAARSRSPFGLCGELGEHLPLEDYLYHALWILSWLFVPLLLLGSSLRRDPERGGLRWVLLVLLLALSFSLSTVASIGLTRVDPDPQVARAGEGLLLALFVLPLACSAVAVGRVLSGGDARATGRIVRASLGLLLSLHGLYVALHWWDAFSSWSGATAGRVLPAAWAPVAGGLLVLAGELRLLVRPPAPLPAPA
jgi:hypothetical protein